MEIVRTKMASRQNDLKLYLEELESGELERVGLKVFFSYLRCIYSDDIISGLRSMAMKSLS